MGETFASTTRKCGQGRADAKPAASCTELRPDAGGQVLGGFPPACLALKVIKREFVEPERVLLPGRWGARSDRRFAERLQSSFSLRVTV